VVRSEPLSTPAPAPPPAAPTPPTALPLIGTSDAAHALALALLLPVAWLVPARRWGPVCRRLGQALVALGARRSAPWRHRLPETVRDPTVLRALPALPGQLLAQKIEALLQVLRAYRPAGWRPAIALDGREHVDRALARGRGAVLWVHRFRPLVHFVAFHRAGLPVSRPSDELHGYFWRSRFGRRWLNPIQNAVERRYCERIVVEPRSMRHLRALRARLLDNRLVSLYWDELAGTRNVTVPFLGGRLRVATRAVTLAAETGAALLPVFPLAVGPDTYRVIVEPPVDLDGPRGRRDLAAVAAARQAARLEWYVRRWPDQWLDWWRVMP
jgi:KDO2-lipid IV(A) lauroyltransferase